MDHFEFGDYEFVSNDFMFVVQRQDAIDGSWVSTHAEPVDINEVDLPNVHWVALEARGIIHPNATWRIVILGADMSGAPLRTSEERRLGHSPGCFKRAYVAAAERYKEQSGFSHRHLQGYGRDAAENVVRATAATMIEDRVVPCSCST